MTRKSAPALLFSTCVVVACGGSAPPPAQAPATKDEPHTVDDAIEEIAAQQALIEDSLKNDSLTREAPASKAEAAPATSGATAQRREEKPVDVCEVRCRAFTSMKNAVGALCRMIGDREARCLSVRRMLEVTAGRVASCGCH